MPFDHHNVASLHSRGGMSGGGILLQWVGIASNCTNSRSSAGSPLVSSSPSWSSSSSRSSFSPFYAERKCEQRLAGLTHLVGVARDCTDLRWVGWYRLLRSPVPSIPWTDRVGFAEESPIGGIATVPTIGDRRNHRWLCSVVLPFYRHHLHSSFHRLSRTSAVPTAGEPSGCGRYSLKTTPAAVEVVTAALVLRRPGQGSSSRLLACLRFSFLGVFSIVYRRR
jgi:hypothetical protein